MGRHDDDDDDVDRPTGKDRSRPAPRRGVLGIVLNTAAATVAVAAAGTGFRAWQTGAGGDLSEGPAFDPWRAWESGAVEGREGIVAAGVLAASPHNSQPWKFAFRDNNLDLSVDSSRNLGMIDPVGREMMIGLGCALENMVVGARALGFSPIVNVLPDGQTDVSRAGGRIARLTLYNGSREKSAESEALARRHTHRGPYLRNRLIPKEVVATLNSKVQPGGVRLIWLDASSTYGKVFSDATMEATEAFAADAELRRDSLAWFRHDLKAVNDKRDGLTTTTAGLTPLKTRGALMLPQRLIGDPHQIWVQQTREVQLPTAPMFGIITVPNLADTAALVEAGRLWQRLHLAGTINGLAMQPLNQMMEIADRDRALQRPSSTADKLAGIIGFPDAIAAFGFRAGYAERPAGPSPRRDVKMVMTA